MQVSGGPDSIFLLHVLGVLAQDSFCSLRVLTLSFETWEDPGVSIVRQFCKQKNYIFRNLRIWIPHQHKQKESLYRAARLKLVRMWSQISPVDFVFLGHHADDLLETQLLKMFRGGGAFSLRNACRQKRGKIVRPLLQISKIDIISYLQKNNIPFFMDPGNRNLDNKRNILRNQLFPQMDALLGPSWRTGVSHSLSALSSDAQLLQTLLFSQENPFLVQIDKNEFSFRPHFAHLPVQLQQSIVHKVLRLLQPQKNFSFSFIHQVTTNILSNKFFLLWDRWVIERGLITELNPISDFFSPVELQKEIEVQVPFGKFSLGSMQSQHPQLQVFADPRYQIFLKRTTQYDQFFSGTKVWKKLSKGKIPLFVKKRFCWSIVQQNLVIAAVVFISPSWETSLSEKGVSPKILWISHQTCSSFSQRIPIFIQKTIPLLGYDNNTPLEKVVFENAFDQN